MNRWLDYAPPRFDIAFLAGAFMLAGIASIFLGGSWYMTYVVPWLALVGLGLWLKHSWARWTAFTFFSLVGVLLVVSIFADGISVRRVFQGLVIAGSLIALWEWNVYPETPADSLENDTSNDGHSPIDTVQEQE
jgi:hypothetical protein